MSYKTSQYLLPMHCLTTANSSLRDVKAEILLTFSLRMFDDYTVLVQKAKEQEYSNEQSSHTNIADAAIILLAGKVDSESEIRIENAVYELRNYLQAHVVSKDKLESVFEKAFNDSQSMLLAKSLEPMGVYYDVLATTFKKHLKKGDPWIPELIGFLLIYYFKIENEKCFNKHPFIQEYDLSEILSIYDSTNIALKKEQLKNKPHEKLWSAKTIIDDMFACADDMVEKYIDFSYKTNINRVSKTRKKKRK